MNARMLPVPAAALIVAAHHDDCEFGCGGTIAKWTAAGSRVSLVVVTDGARGSHDVEISDRALSTLRRHEQEASGRLLGIESIVFLDERDGELEPSRDLVRRLAALVRRARPEIVLTHDPAGAYLDHPDHWVVGDAVWKALVRAREPRFVPSAEPGAPAWRARELWLFGAADPDHVEPIGDQLEMKLTALLCHASQYETAMHFAPGDDDGRMRFRQRVEERAHAAGALAQTGPAEAFRRRVLA